MPTTDPNASDVSRRAIQFETLAELYSVAGEAARSSANCTRRLRRLMILPAAAVFAVAGLLRAQTADVTTSIPAVLHLVTSEGALVVRVDDPDVSVRVEGGELIITGAGLKELRLRPRDFQAPDSDNGPPLGETLVTITRGDKQILSIRRGTALAEAAASASESKLRQDATAGESHPATKRLFNPATGHDYQRIDVAMTWHDARKYCEQLGGHLATATTAEENEFIYSQFGQDHVCWLGATDDEGEGVWRWITGEPWDYENWHAGEPSNNTDGDPENYLTLGNSESVVADGVSYFYRFGAKWNDHVATGKYHGASIAYPVCEWDEHDPQKAATPVIDETASLRNLQRAMREGASGDELITTAAAHIKAFPDSPRNRAVAQMLVMSLTRDQGEQQGIDAIQKLAEHELEQVAEAAKDRIQQLETMLQLKQEPLGLKFTAVDGREFNLEEYRGKVVLVDFWATWCGPCVARMPELIDLYQTHHEQGLEIVGISFDRDKESLEKFVAEREVPWVQFFDGKTWDNEFGRQYGIRAIPTLWLVGRDGKVVDFNARTNLSEKVERLLDE